MRLSLFAAAAFLWVAAAVAADSGVILHTVAIRDVGGFAPGDTVLTVQVPSDWRSEGGVVWTTNANCLFLPVSVMFGAQREDGLAGFAIWPGAMRAWSSDPAVNRQYESAAADGATGCLAPDKPLRVLTYLNDVFLAHHRGDRADARILDARRLTAIADEIGARLAGEIGAGQLERLRQAGGEAEIYGDAGVFDIGYRVNGRAIRERVFVSLGVNEITMPHPAQGVAERTSSFTDKVVSWYAPEEEFEALTLIFDVMLASFAYNQRWTDLTARSIGRMVSQADGELLRLHRTNVGSRAPVSDRIDGVPFDSPLLIDRSRRIGLAYFRDRRTLVEPGSGAFFDMPAHDGPGGPAFYADGRNGILVTSDPSAVDRARWTRLGSAP